MQTRKVNVEITTPDGDVVFSKPDFEVPEFWSDRAATIVASKYATDDEQSALQVIGRVAAQITKWGVAQGYFGQDVSEWHEDTVLSSCKDKHNCEVCDFYGSLMDILINQRASFNSPVWFNCGVPENSPQMSACFVIPVEDNMESILNHAVVEGMIFKSGSGAGVNVSKLRAQGEKLSNKGEASGPVSFMEGWDAFAGIIKSGGKVRRAAKLVCMDVDHPDIFKFIECKQHEERKAKILIANGIDPEEAYHTVFFQNTNHSIRTTDEFMNIIRNKRDEWALVNRGDSKLTYTSARKILRAAAEVAWETGDPGIQFHDRMNSDNPVPSMGEIRSTNPCFAGDTRISTPYGYRRIIDLVALATTEGIMTDVHTEDGIISTPIAFMATGKNDILRVELSDGRVIKTTPNHNWFISGQKIPACELEPGMPIELIHQRRPKRRISADEQQLSVKEDINDYRTPGTHFIEDANFPATLTAEFAEILGHLTGDGYISDGEQYSVGWIFGTHPDESEKLHDRYKTVLNKYLPINTTTNTNGCRVLRYNRRPVLNYFVDLGFSRCKAHEKRVPEIFFKAEPPILKQYLCGYFGADGTVYGKEEEGSCSVNCASTSPELLRDIQLLLDVFNIRSWIKKMKDPGQITFADGKTYNTRATYRLSIDPEDVRSFHELIGFSVDYKNNRLASLLECRKTVKPRRKQVHIVSVVKQKRQEITYNLTEPINNLVFANGVLIAQCSEFSAVDNSSCNLASLNLVKYMNPEAEDGFDDALFRKDIHTMITAMDIMVEAAEYPTEDIRKTTIATRPLGLGFTNLGAYLMLIGLPYDSEEARETASKITKLMSYCACERSIELAKKLGPFEKFEENKETCLEITERIAGAPRGLKTHGLRNSQLTLLAPTGTISFMMDCDTTGIEPLFALRSTKQLAGGGTLELTPACVQKSFENLGDYVQDNRPPNKDISEHISDLPEAKRAIFKTANEIRWRDHILMMAACQKHLNGAISKCVTGDTLILTHEGIMPIGSFYNGETSDTFREEDIVLGSISKPQKADLFYYGGERETLKITLRDGRTIEGTPNHKLKVANSKGYTWKRLDEITGDDYVAIKLGSDIWAQETLEIGFTPPKLYGRQKRVSIPQTLDRDLGWLFGAYIADGNTTPSNWTIHITNNNGQVLSKIANIVESRFGIGARLSVDKRRGTQAVHISSKTLCMLFDWLGCGGNAETKEIPWSILQSPKEVVQSFVSGLWLDGYVRNANATVAICLKSEKIIRQLQVIMNNFGLRANIITKHNKEYNRDFFELLIHGEDLMKFSKLFTLDDPWKQETLDVHCKVLPERKHNRIYSDVVPCYRQEIKQIVLEKGTRSKYTSVFDHRTQNLSWQLVNDIYLESFDEVTKHAPGLHEICYDNIHFARVTHKEDAEAEVYDFQVPENHAFIGNGIINHNTINIPTDATVEDVEEAYMMAWKEGLKSVAVYRDGSKDMQPLTAAPEDTDEEEPDEDQWMAFRRRLPETRQSITHKFNVGGLDGYLTIGIYDDGSPGEIFIRTQKQGSTMQGVLDAFATAVSYALQYGVPLEVLVGKFVGSKFEPAGFTTNEDIKLTTSIMDYIFRWLSIQFIDEEDEDDSEPSRPSMPPNSKVQFDGPPCPKCQSVTGRSGHCYLCPQCGETTGCS
jgi:ribonucleoside-diphosphate reductase alpha chain